jgi:hypothetical protein
MARRRFILLAIVGLVLLVLLADLGYLLLRPSSPISQAGCDLINEGMSLADVEVILGCPAGDYHDRDHPVVVSLLPRPAPGLVQKVWIGNHGAVVVHFDKNDGVMHVHFSPELNRAPTFVEQLRRKLRL